MFKKVLLGDAQRDLKDSEKMLCGVSAGVLSSVVCGPIELIMIQQQAKGGGLVGTAIDMVKAGPSTFFRGAGRPARTTAACGATHAALCIAAPPCLRAPPARADRTR